MFSLRFELVKERLVEFIKYDLNSAKYPLVFIAWILVFILQMVGNHTKAFAIASRIYRTGWAGSYTLGLQTARYYFVDHKELGIKISKEMVKTIPVLKQTKKFFANPLDMLKGVIFIIKKAQGGEKGVLLLNYNYYFPLFLKFFDINRITERYNIILEPSWAGFCDLDILAYSLLKTPIFVQAYEERDQQFITDLGGHLKPIKIGPSWFVNHKNFVAPNKDAERDIDIIMVAAWAKFKRHRYFFKILSALKHQGRKLAVVLVGYPVDMSQEDILDLASLYNVKDLLTVYEWITPDKVAELYKRSKINILWSKFEGNNRAIIEGMFCDTPAILRKGHNYGQHYDFINQDSGHFANENDLSSVISKILRDFDKYKPRNYVMRHRNCIIATEIMNQALKDYELSEGRPWFLNLEVKINELHGMAYLEESNYKKFNDEYKELEKFLQKKHE